MMNTWNALIAALLLITFATACDEGHVPGPAGPTSDSILAYDLALAPLHYLDGAGRLYELLVAVDPDGHVAAACYVVDGALFASIATRPGGVDADVQIYQGNRAEFHAVVTPAALPAAAAAWPAFAAAAAETRGALATWQGSASGVAIGQLHAALSRLTAASAALVAPVTRKGG